MIRVVPLRLRGFQRILRVDLPVVLVTAIALALMTPIVITWDGYLYVQSSIYVFGSEAVANYHWLREPLYPLILKSARIVFGGADVFLIFVQACALAVAALLIADAFARGRRLMKWAIYVAIVFNPISMVYAAAVLQTVWIILFVAIFTRLIIYAWQSPPAATHRVLTLLGATTIAGSYLSFQIGYLGLGAGLAIGYPLARNWLGREDRLRGKPVARHAACVGAALMLGVTAYLVAVASLAPWDSYKRSVTDGPRGGEVRFGDSFNTGPSDQVGVVVGDRTTGALNVTRSGLSLLSLRGPFIDENAVFSNGLFSAASRCGRLFPAEPHPEAVANTLSRLQPTCRSLPWLVYGYVIQPRSQLMVKISSLALLLAIPVLLLARRWSLWLALLPSLQLILMYAAISADINRYAFPVYPVGIALAILAASAVVQKFIMRFNARQASTST